MTERTGVKTKRFRDVPSGAPDPKRPTVVFQGPAQLIDFAGDGDAGAAEHVSDLGVAEARGIVFEGDLVFLLVDAEFPQAIGVGEFAEALELLKAQRGLQFISNFKKRHGRRL